MDQALLNNPGIDRHSFDRLSSLVYRESGITLKWEKATLMVGRLSRRLAALGLQEYAQYADLLESNKHPREMTEFLDAMSTNVTYFFREPDHFDFLRTAQTQLLRTGQKRVRVWCAAASTGDEPYTLAMTLRDTTPRDVDLRLLATDISTNALAKAISGIYPEKAMTNVPKQLLSRFFSSSSVAGETQYSATEELRSILLFRQFNLVKFPYKLSGPLDFIFCRNVMIYFDPPTRQKIVNEFTRLLRPGGHLIISHSESLSDLDIQLQMTSPSIYAKNT